MPHTIGVIVRFYHALINLAKARYFWYYLSQNCSNLTTIIWLRRPNVTPVTALQWWLGIIVGGTLALVFGLFFVCIAITEGWRFHKRRQVISDGLGASLDLPADEFLEAFARVRTLAGNLTDSSLTCWLFESWCWQPIVSYPLLAKVLRKAIQSRMCTNEFVAEILYRHFFATTGWGIPRRFRRALQKRCPEVLQLMETIREQRHIPFEPV
jgi:hypothetical protein